jgi:SAM-dependent methyltransferase
MARTPDVQDTYPLGRSEAETQRLILQNQIYGPLTRQFLVAAGVTAGMTVVELGAGAGDVALTAAELVGPEGRVICLDVDAEILRTAAARVAAVGWTNVDYQHVQPDGLVDLVSPGWDAVIGRWVLMYQPDPVEQLRRLARQLRPGGVVAFQEGVFNDLREPYPPGPLHEQLNRWMTPPAGGPGPDTEMGLKLFRTFLDAGLPPPRLRMDTPVGGGAGWPGPDYVVATFRSLFPMLVQLGIVSEEEVDIDTLADRLRAELVETQAIQFLPPLIGAFSRVA